MQQLVETNKTELGSQHYVSVMFEQGAKVFVWVFSTKLMLQ